MQVTDVAFISRPILETMILASGLPVVTSCVTIMTIPHTLVDLEGMLLLWMRQVLHVAPNIEREARARSKLNQPDQPVR